MCLHRDKCRDFQDHLNECLPEESGRKGRGKETKTQYHVVLEAFGNAIDNGTNGKLTKWASKPQRDNRIWTMDYISNVNDEKFRVLLCPLLPYSARYFYYPSPSLTTFLVLLQNLLGLPTKRTPNTLITIDNTPRCITGGLLSQITHDSA